jgi:hypothetical protein
MSSGSKPRRIEPDFRSRVWGAPSLEPWFQAAEAARRDDVNNPVGEVWFPADDLLIKFIFTSQNLSVCARAGEFARQNGDVVHPAR